MNEALVRTEFKDLKLVKRGKVRDIYNLGRGQLLIVTSDRMSAFDVVMEEPIPDKGKTLNGISAFWFKRLEHIVPNHVISTDPNEYPEICQPFSAALEGRSMLVYKAQPLEVECIVRGYITGSGWEGYCETGKVCGIPLPDGLKEAEKLPSPIFTPSTKAEEGDHDENITFEKASRIVGAPMAHNIRRISLDLYTNACEIAESSGIIIADTKFEFGLRDGHLILIDELLTPDSSRFWPANEYEPGRSQPSFDKQFLRDYLNGLDWNKKPPPPKLPADIIRKTRRKYQQVFELLTR